MLTKTQSIVAIDRLRIDLIETTIVVIVVDCIAANNKHDFENTIEIEIAVKRNSEIESIWKSIVIQNWIQIEKN